MAYVLGGTSGRLALPGWLGFDEGLGQSFEQCLQSVVGRVGILTFQP